MLGAAEVAGRDRVFANAAFTEQHLFPGFHHYSTDLSKYIFYILFTHLFDMLKLRTC